MVEKSEEWKIAGGQNYSRKKYNDKETKKSQIYYKELEDKEDDNELKTKLGFKKLYYRHMRETKILYNYIYY